MMMLNRVLKKMANVHVLMEILYIMVPKEAAQIQL
jgi:hypothetical protein